jgi:spore coat protein U-like protein
MSRWLSRSGLLVAVLFLPGPRMMAAVSCSFVSATGIAFGAYDPLDTRSTVQAGVVRLKCSQMGGPLLPVIIELSAGNSGSYAGRHLKKGGESLRYNLFLDAAGTQVWGNGTGGSAHFGPFLPAENVETTIPIYGRIFPGQSVTAGSYTDTISVTINY